MDTARMVDAYVRRKAWEARQLALAVWSVLGESMQGGRSGRRINPRRQVPANEFMRVTGAKF